MEAGKFVRPLEKSPLLALQKETKWYAENQEELVKKYRNRYVVIVGNELIADYETIGDGYRTTILTHKPGTFMIRKCIPKSEERLVIVM